MMEICFSQLYSSLRSVPSMAGSDSGLFFAGRLVLSLSSPGFPSACCMEVEEERDLFFLLCTWTVMSPTGS